LAEPRNKFELPLYEKILLYKKIFFFWFCVKIILFFSKKTFISKISAKLF